MAKTHRKQAVSATASFAKAERTKLFRDFLVSADETFASLPEERQSAWASLLYNIHIGNFSHNSGEPREFPLHWKPKQKRFKRAAIFNEDNAALGWCRKVRGAKVGKSAEGWVLTPRAKKLLADYHELGKQQHLPFYDIPDSARAFVDEDDRPCRKPRSPIASKASNGTNTKFKPWSLPINVAVDGNNLHAFLYAATARLNGDPCPVGFQWAWKAWDKVDPDKLEYRLSEAIGQAGEFLKTAWVSKLKGFVVYQCYHETTSGRLLADGPLNLQNCHKEVRQACLPEHYDYDVDCCHYALLSSLAKQQGHPTPHIDAYISNKKVLRNKVRLAAGEGTSDEDAKKIITSLIYGAPLIASHKASIGQRIGEKAAGNLCKSGVLAPLYEEMKSARSAVLEAHRGEVGRTGKLTNRAGRRIPAKGVKASKLLSHILTGEESEVLKEAIAYASEHIVLLAHDGFVTTQPIDKAGLEQNIKKYTGHSLRLTESQFAPSGPIPQKG